MFIKKIKLNNFRNYENEEIDFCDEINIIYGDNAQGKTNIIEAIFISAFGKSFRAKKDSELIRFEKNNAITEVEFQTKDRTGNIKVEFDDKKVFYINGVKQKKISNIIGNINIVICTPDDINIIKDGPSKRRKFLDMMISSLKPNYLYLLNNYNKILEQRNNYLRKFNQKDIYILDIFDDQLSEYSEKIYEYRKKYIEKIYQKQKVIHQNITESGKVEQIDIKYISNFQNKEQFKKLLYNNRNVDIKKGYTSIGIHRDDFTISINNKSVQIYASQGQQRTTVLSLKLAELEIVKEEIGENPILLLDHFMSELDENRKESFLEKVIDNQVIITCTQNMDIKNKTVKSFNIKNGKLYKK